MKIKEGDILYGICGHTMDDKWGPVSFRIDKIIIWGEDIHMELSDGEMYMTSKEARELSRVLIEMADVIDKHSFVCQ